MQTHVMLLRLQESDVPVHMVEKIALEMLDISAPSGPFVTPPSKRVDPAAMTPPPVSPVLKAVKTEQPEPFGVQKRIHELKVIRATLQSHIGLLDKRVLDFDVASSGGQAHEDPYLAKSYLQF